MMSLHCPLKIHDVYTYTRCYHLTWFHLAWLGCACSTNAVFTGATVGATPLSSTQIYPFTIVPPTSFVEFMLPKRRFWKDEQTHQTAFSKHFSTFRAQIRYSRPLKALRKCSLMCLFILPKSSFGEHKVVTKDRSIPETWLWSANVVSHMDRDSHWANSVANHFKNL